MASAQQRAQKAKRRAHHEAAAKARRAARIELARMELLRAKIREQTGQRTRKD